MVVHLTISPEQTALLTLSNHKEVSTMMKGWTLFLFSVPNVKKYSSCTKLYQAGYRDNGMYKIYPASLNAGLQVYCDMETDGGGWIVFQRRHDGSVDFYRTWSEYASGFGDMQNEFWLGNDILRALTGTGQWELRVDMDNWQSTAVWASYGEFAVTGDKYTLNVGSYDAQSTTSDSMFGHNGQPFTAKDQDNDGDTIANCAELWEGAWWFTSCYMSHLNGKYYPQEDVPFGRGVKWAGWWYGSDYFSLKKCSMKIRQVL
ncbi:ryncolin-1-like [Asterias amurensis]|uniref:ryncolin-1-like n=1 Tax=Asterias amurensis TaxID=7602 RepID=UPI003AB36AE9